MSDLKLSIIFFAPFYFGVFCFSMIYLFVNGDSDKSHFYTLTKLEKLLFFLNFIWPIYVLGAIGYLIFHIFYFFYKPHEI